MSTALAQRMQQQSHKKYWLLVLAAILTFNFVDRFALGVLLQDIKIDLSLSDTQLGFLSGIAFALFYSVMGIPIARWADRGDRVTIISLTTLLWSGAVALCGMAGNFVQLLLVRIGVAVGEAGCIPPAHSLIADYFTRAERPRAVAIYMLGAPLSMVIGYFLAGWLNEFYGWRATFMMLGLPGLALAVLAWLTLKEPRRDSLPMEEAASTPQPSLKDACVILWANATFRHLLICFAVLQFFGYGIWQWQPAFLMRSYGLASGDLGTWLAISAGLGGIIGTLGGGELASRMAANNESLQLKAMAGGCCSFGALLAGVYVAPNPALAFVLIALASIGGAAVNGPLFATIQTLVPQRLRAISIAIVYLFANLIGMGLGPLAAGVLSDAFRPWAGEESLRYALLALCPGYLWAAWHLWRASRTIPFDLKNAQ
jgi:MFS family permease